MTARARIPAGLVGLACCGALLSACGGSSTAIDSASFVSYCSSHGPTASQCRCLQKKLVADGDGGISYTAKTAPPKVEADTTRALVACGMSSVSPPSGSGTGTTG